MDNVAIQVRQLRRTFRAYEKEPGVLGALRSAIKRNWKEVVAVDNISFDIEQGEFVGFIGPNGAGKTTTLKMLSGILTPTSGECTVMGHTPHLRARSFRKNIALVMGQKSQLIWDLPAIDTFTFHRDLYEISRHTWQERMDFLTEMLNLTEVVNTPVRQLSLGERMKCELIVALLHNPKVLFLDEPTIGLDAPSQRQLWHFLKEYQQKTNSTILLTSHYMQDIVQLCKRGLVIDQGRIYFDGSIAELHQHVEENKIVEIQFAQKLTVEQQEKLRSNSLIKKIDNIDDHSVRLEILSNQMQEFITWINTHLDIRAIQFHATDMASVMEKIFALSAKKKSIFVETNGKGKNN